MNKKRLFLCLSIAALTVFSLLTKVFGQAANYVIHDMSNVASYSLTVSDTAYTGQHSLRASFTPGTGTTVVPRVVWKRSITNIPAPSGIRFWAYTPPNDDAPLVVISLKSGAGQSTTIPVQINGTGWRLYQLSTNLIGFSVDTLFIGVSSSDMSGKKTIFIDDLEGGYPSGSWITLEDGEAPLPVSPTPALLSPANGATNMGTDVQFTCVNINISGALYSFQIARNNDFSSIILNYETDTNLITYQGLSLNTQYYWRAKTKIPGHQYSDWSSAWSFNTGTSLPIPEPPVLLSPTNGASNVPNPVFFDWSDMTNATLYRVQITLGNGVIVADASITTSSYTVDLLPATYYLWRVNASNSAGTSEWSPLQGFTTAQSVPQPPLPPTLSAPSDKAVSVPVNAPLYWGAVSGATSYYLEVATDASFGVTIYGINASGTSATTTPLQYNSVYWWRVRSSNGLTMSEWSAVRSFTTVDWHSTSIETDPQAPTAFELQQNYPNPFNPTTTINFSLPENDFVTLTVYNYIGQQVATLVNSNMSAGTHSINFDGYELPSGMYIYRLEQGGVAKIKKMLLVK